MKRWKYRLYNRPSIVEDDGQIWEGYFVVKTLPATEENELIAQEEAYNGEYELYDDGEPEITTTDDVLNAMLGVM